MDDIKLAMLGNKEAAKRLTDAGERLPCPFCGSREIIVFQNEKDGAKHWANCMDCLSFGPRGMSKYSALLAWNTRAPILSESELKKLRGGGEED